MVVTRLHAVEAVPLIPNGITANPLIGRIGCAGTVQCFPVGVVEPLIRDGGAGIRKREGASLMIGVAEAHVATSIHMRSKYARPNIVTDGNAIRANFHQDGMQIYAVIEDMNTGFAVR